MNSLPQDNEIHWPCFFPVDCPPADASAANGNLYRFVKNNPPNGIDFTTYRELDRELSCKACGLSVYIKLDDAHAARDAVPGFRKRNIAKLSLPLPKGKLKPTPSRPGDGHHTWWIPSGVNPRDFIAEVIGPQ
jgi:hypothetical protein